MAVRTHQTPKRLQTKEQRWAQQFKQPSWVNPVEPDPLHDVVTPCHRQPLSNKKPTSVNSVWLRTILPDLTRWRFYTFYASFFSVLDLHTVPSPLLPPRENDKDGQPESSATATARAQEQDPGQAARETALRIAQCLFTSLDQRVRRVDLIAILDAFHVERKQHLRRLACGITTAKGLPTVEAILEVAKVIDIPLSQIDIALSLYKAFVEINRHHQSAPLNSQVAYQHIGALFMASDRRWASLASILYEDFRDVCTFSIFSKLERENPRIVDEMATFRNAVTACRSRYFKDLRERDPVCSCRSSTCSKTQTPSPTQDAAPPYSPRSLSLDLGSSSTEQSIGHEAMSKLRRPSIRAIIRGLLDSKSPIRLPRFLTGRECSRACANTTVLYTLNEGVTEQPSRSNEAECVNVAASRTYAVFGRG